MDDWLQTRSGDPRGYIQPHALEELWFHTGTACNLACPFCLEGSKPGDNRLQRMSLADVQPLMQAAVRLGTQRFSFTGGEPFVVRDFVRMLEFAASLRPCLVLTNGTDALLKRLHQLERLRQAEHPVSFRVSIDWPDESRHEAGRGSGTFQQSLQAIASLQSLGFAVSLARQSEPGEDQAAVEAAFQQLVQAAGYTGQIRIIAFPDFGVPASVRQVPEITTDCMTRYHDTDSRAAFMCAFSKMVVKQEGRMRIYACTLVDDDPRYDQGEDLALALQQRVMLAHHRCYSCFAFGSSCSEG